MARTPVTVNEIATAQQLVAEARVAFGALADAGFGECLVQRASLVMAARWLDEQSGWIWRTPEACSAGAQ